MILHYASNTLVNYYVHGPGVDEPIARIEVSGSTLTPHYYVTDHQGSIIGETQYGSAATANTYDTYGRPDANNTGLYQYTGQVWLDDLELYYYKARFYDPKIRRFLNTDPIGYGDGMNTYAYVSGDPTNLIDPSGENAIWRIFGSMYHKDAHDGPGGLWAPDGQLGDAYAMFSAWTQSRTGLTGMEYLAHPDSNNYYERLATSFIDRGAGLKACSKVLAPLLRDGPAVPYVGLQISADRTFPSGWRRSPGRTFLTHGVLGSAATYMGAHEYNYRIAGTGLHISSETASDGSELPGLYIHHDFFDPTNGPASAIMHGIWEVRPLGAGEIESGRSDGNIRLNVHCVSQYLRG